MPSAVYLHDGEHQITVTFRKEEDRERFKAHYRALDALAVQYRAERDAAQRLLTRYADTLTMIHAGLPPVGRDAHYDDIRWRIEATRGSETESPVDEQGEAT